MAEAIRRLLGLVPVLLVGSIVLFFLLSKHPKVARELSLPLFFAQEPISASSAAERAMRGAALGDRAAVRELQALGGAALPHVLPRLSELPVTQRRRIAEALEPVALRMQVGGYRAGTSLDSALADPSSSADQQLLSWERYYEDHDLDFRPLSVERLVKRLSTRRSGMREADLLAVDTYALPHLVRALGRVDSPEDADRVKRLSPVIARLWGQSLRLPEDLSPEQARVVSSDLRRQFDRTGFKFTNLGRFEELTAHVMQTEFGLWWVQNVREIRGIDAPRVYAALSRGFWQSAPLLTWSFVGALLLGPLAAGVLHLALLQRRGPRGLRRLRLGLALGSTLFIPLLCLRGPVSTALAALALLLTATLASTALLSGYLSGKLDWRSRATLLRRPRTRRLMSVGSSLLLTLPTLLPVIAGEVFLWIACLELSSGRDGLFPRTMLALQRGDLHALLAMSLLSWISIAVVQTLSDALLASSEQGAHPW